MKQKTENMLCLAFMELLRKYPFPKITIQKIAEQCGVNRQTFYYHFDDVYDLLEWVFEEDANKVLPSEVSFSHWREDVLLFFKYLYDNSTFALNIYNSQSRTYMLRYYKRRIQSCIRSFAVIVSEGQNIDRGDFEFVVEFYSNCVVGLISQWLDLGMKLPKEITPDRLMTVLEDSVENLLDRFDKK